MPKRKCIFSDKLKTTFKCFDDGRDVNEAKCTVCDCYVSVANKGNLHLVVIKSYLIQCIV